MKKRIIILTGIFILSSAVFGFGIWNYFVHEIGQAPVLEADTDIVSLSVYADTLEYLQDVHAVDFEDGNLDDSIYIDSISDLSDSDTAEIRYIVFDSNNNPADLTRTIQYTDYTKPTFFLKQKFVVQTSVNSPDFSEYIGATDVLAGDISNDIKLVDTTLNVYTPGQYTVTFSVEDNKGEAQEIVLPIIVESATKIKPSVDLNTYIAYINVNSEIDLSSYVEQVVNSNGDIVPFTFDAEGYTYEMQEQGIALITVEPNIDLTTPGTYNAVYTVTDTLGNTDNSILTVVVR